MVGVVDPRPLHHQEEPLLPVPLQPLDRRPGHVGEGRRSPRAHVPVLKCKLSLVSG